MYGIDPNLFMNAALGLVLGTGALLLVATVLLSWLGRRGRVVSYLYMLTALFVAFIAVVGVLGFRGRTSDERPWHIVLDMKYQPKYTSQGASKYFADGRSSRLPPADTVPFDGTDYAADAGRHDAPNPDFLKADRRFYQGIADPTKKTADGAPMKPEWGADKAGKRTASETYWVNHLPPLAVERAGGWEALLKRGQVQFNRHCAVCHGTSGRGGAGELAYGIVGAYGLSVAPANLVDATNPPNAPQQPDGQLYNTVVNGKGSMSGYGHQIKDVVDRWAIVAYMRELQFAYVNEPAKKK